MVTGTYGTGLVQALYNISSASGQDPQLVSPIQIKQIEKDLMGFHLRTLPLEYTGDIKLGLTLATSEGLEDTLAIVRLDPKDDIRSKLEGLMGETVKASSPDDDSVEQELPVLVTPPYLVRNGSQASEVYEQIRKLTPQTMSQLRAILGYDPRVEGSYEHREKTAPERGTNFFTPNRNATKFSPEMRRRLQRH